MRNVPGPVTIRRARPDDAPWIVRELKHFSASYGLRSVVLFPEHDPAYADAFVATIIRDHLLVVAERRAARIGFIAGHVGPHPYSPAVRTLVEMWWWVAPAHRGSRAGKLLLDAFLAWGEAHVDLITVGTVAGSTNVRAASLARQGLRLHEYSYVLECRRPGRPTEA